MKKFVSALLVLSLVVALFSVAFAYKDKPLDDGTLVKFTGSAWGYTKIDNNTGKAANKSSVALRKGSVAEAVAIKGDWYKVAVPKRGKTDEAEYFYFNKKYVKVDNKSSKAKLIYSSGGSGRSGESDEDEVAIDSKYKKVTIAKKGRRTNIRKTASLKGASLGVLRYGKSLKLHSDKVKKEDSRGVYFYKVKYNGKTAWVSEQYTKLKK